MKLSGDTLATYIVLERHREFIQEFSKFEDTVALHVGTVAAVDMAVIWRMLY